MPHLERFELDASVLAPRMYRDFPHQTTDHGLVIETVVRMELTRFLEDFLAFLGCKDVLFMRIDAYVGEASLTIIEVNVELQDGWGVSLNLLRAAGSMLSMPAPLPESIIVYNDDYLPEFELAKREMAAVGHKLELVSWRDRPGVAAKSPFDDKLYLTHFSRVWRGRFVRLPVMHEIAGTAWDQLPDDVVFKFREKYGDQARKARYSVKRRCDLGKGKFMRQCYEAGSAIAQEFVEPLRLSDGSAVQAVLMCSGSTPITGYTQVAPPEEFVINDKYSRKGPLILR